MLGEQYSVGIVAGADVCSCAFAESNHYPLQILSQISMNVLGTGTSTTWHMEQSK